VSNSSTDVEGVELAVLRGGLVEPHLVDDVLDLDGVLGEQRHAPLVGVEADRGSDDLLYPSGEGFAGFPVAAHHVGAVLEGEGIPVVFGATTLAHRVETDVLVVRDVGFELPFDVVPEPGVDVLDVALEVVVRDVARDLRHREIGSRLCRKACQRRLFELAFGPRERIEARPEVDDHEVGLVAEDREDRRRTLTVLDVSQRLVGREILFARGKRPLPFVFGGLAPRVPVDRPEIVQRVPSFVRLWDFDHARYWVSGGLGFTCLPS